MATFAGIAYAWVEFSATDIGLGANEHFALCSPLIRNNCVIDGDTIWYRGEKIRIEDINAPETSKPQCPSEAALGERATHRLMELLNAGPFNVVHDGGRDEDRYGRKLRIIERNGQSLAMVLVAEGLARPWSGQRRSWCS